MDATCSPADIRYPNDMSILNEARRNTESMIDYLYLQFPKYVIMDKPRIYREIAHNNFIAYTKKRKPGHKVRRAAIRKQLNYLRRNIRHVENMMMCTESDKIPYRMIDRFEVIKEVYYQQNHMYRKNERRVPNRIVSISQPHVRPIVRGKAGKPVEFGAKISLSLCDGFSFIDHLSWNSYNESKDLIPQIEKYKERYGYYPASVHADKIYQTRENRKFCKDHGIRMTGKPLGRPLKETEENKDKLKENRRQRYQDDVDRIAVEGRFGVSKRKYGLGLIKSKLKETSETDIYLSIFVMNLDKLCTEELTEIQDRYKIKRNRAA